MLFAHCLLLVVKRQGELLPDTFWQLYLPSAERRVHCAEFRVRAAARGVCSSRAAAILDSGAIAFAASYVVLAVWV